MIVLLSIMCDYFDSGVFGKARRVPVQPASVSDCDSGDADCTINEIRGLWSFL